ncbi:MAG: 30S ribosomal protein S2 [Candidatus Anoxymicrobium japonicum]|uniref:Small ribosomal subunit protein uS2 n=1 Tax=Candidatus Anoxymicrobium japonicum TaxID=2013648 RepID=A0A2N3G7Y8_9ACTN|nr:MAG: 30S ribosomal protein S2 [Candidatus Anoxymicrobium japonicum]
MTQPVVTMKELLEAGVHFGHQRRRWNPKMKQYIFTERNDIYVIDLQKTLVMTGTAYNAIRNAVADGGNVLFVGTKKQAQEAVEEHATRCAMPFVTQRWLGGTLTNFSTIHSRIMHMDELERRDRDGELELIPKKEALQIRRQIDKLRRNLEGIRNMHALPSMIFVIDPHKERIAVAEGRKLGIPIVGLVDTNCDPEEVDLVIPGNDDAIRAIGLLCRVVADGVIDGMGARDARLADEIAQQADIAREKCERAPVRVGGAVPAYSASPDDISGPAITPGFPGDVKKELTVDAVEEPVVLDPEGVSLAEQTPDGG